MSLVIVLVNPPFLLLPLAAEGDFFHSPVCKLLVPHSLPVLVLNHYFVRPRIFSARNQIPAVALLTRDTAASTAPPTCPATHRGPQKLLLRVMRDPVFSHFSSFLSYP